MLLPLLRSSLVGMTRILTRADLLEVNEMAEETPEQILINKKMENFERERWNEAEEKYTDQYEGWKKVTILRRQLMARENCP